jgi:DNA replication and repair protein RecF
MIFTDIRLQNYRSYTDESFELEPGVNIIVGPNTAGKTNLLEALMIASVGKSYRAADGVLIKKDQTWARVDVHNSDSVLRTVKIVVEPSQKITKLFEIDARIYKKLPPANKQPVVLFEPNHLNLLSGEPSLRRDYLDDFLDQYLLNHNQAITKLKRTLAQRNRLLKMPRLDKTQLFSWDVRLCEVSEIIAKNRLEIINLINKNIAEVYSSIAGRDTKISVHYQTKLNPNNYSASLMQALVNDLEKDIIRGFTSNGPHRDDLSVLINGSPLSESASRGENRSFMLALKILELKILEEKTTIRPLLLLDDVFSELDGARRKSLTNYLKNYQTLITTTDADVIQKNFTRNVNKITI